MTQKENSLVAENILTTKQIWLEKIDFVSKEMTDYLREDCREYFKYCLVTYNDIPCHSIISISDLGKSLEQKELKTGAALIGELQKIYDFATANQIQEILFD